MKAEWKQKCHLNLSHSQNVMNKDNFLTISLDSFPSIPSIYPSIHPLSIFHKWIYCFYPKNVCRLWLCVCGAEWMRWTFLPHSAHFNRPHGHFVIGAVDFIYSVVFVVFFFFCILVLVTFLVNELVGTRTTVFCGATKHTIKMSNSFKMVGFSFRANDNKSRAFCRFKWTATFFCCPEKGLITRHRHDSSKKFCGTIIEMEILLDFSPFTMNESWSPWPSILI